MCPSIFHRVVMVLILAAVFLPVLPLRAAELANEAVWQEAQQFQQAEQFAQAADRHRTILSQETHWKKRAKAAVLAANCLDRLGRSTESIPLLDAAIAEADNLLAQNKPGIDEAWTLSALYGKAVACEKTGDRAGALKAIERIRAQFFKSDEAREAIQIQARLEGWSRQKLTQTLAREQEAMQLAEQAAEASKQKRHKEALESCDRIIQQYADTAAVFPAMRTKALTLWNNSRYREAKAVYQTILDRVKPIAPHSRLVRTAEYRVAWLDAGQMSKDFVLKRRKGMPPADAEWQQLRERCQTILRLDPSPEERADARLMIIQSYCWQERRAESLQAAEAFIRECDSEKRQAKFGYQVAWAHIFAGISATSLGRHQEAIEHTNKAFEYASQCSDMKLRPHILDAAYFWRWHALRQSGADEQQFRQWAEQHLAELPDAPNARFVRWHMLTEEREQMLRAFTPTSRPVP